MKKTRFFVPFSELRDKLRGTNAEVIEVFMYLLERIVATLLSLFLATTVFLGPVPFAETCLFLVSWIAVLYLSLLLLFFFFSK